MRLGVMDARSERYPVLSFTGGYSYNQSRSETGFLIRNQSYGTSYGLILSYTLFNGFDVSRTIKNARVMLNSSETEVKDAEEEIGMNILQTFNNYIASLEIVRMQQVNVEVARENVTIAFEKYQLGSLNDVELRGIQLKLIDAQYQLLFAGFEAKKSEVELMRWSGMLLNASF
jgi:outer membrane protein TolC